MNQMTEASKKRMEEGAIGYSKEVAPESIEQWVAGGYRKGYQAGMQDPEDNKELLRQQFNRSQDLSSLLNECEIFFDQLNKSAFWVPPALRGVFNHERISGLLNKIREARK